MVRKNSSNSKIHASADLEPMLSYVDVNVKYNVNGKALFLPESSPAVASALALGAG
jgi:hypothetical protein